MSTSVTESEGAKGPRLQNIAIPDDVHRALKIAAIRSGKSLREFVEPALRRLAEGESDKSQTQLGL